MVPFVAHRVALRPVVVVLASSGPVIVLVSASLFVDAGIGVDASGRYRAFV
jgi:hypothetical protein